MRKPVFNITKTARSLATQSGTSFVVTRKAIRDAVRAYMEAHGVQSLAANSVVPGHLPDGTLFVVLPDVHVPANDRKIRRTVKQWLKEFRESGMAVNPVSDNPKENS